MAYSVIYHLYIPDIYHLRFGIYMIYTWYIPGIYVSNLTSSNVGREPGLYPLQTFLNNLISVTLRSRHFICGCNLTCSHGSFHNVICSVYVGIVNNFLKNSETSQLLGNFRKIWECFENFGNIWEYLGNHFWEIFLYRRRP
jgi:hypothetical protein